MRRSVILAALAAAALGGAVRADPPPPMSTRDFVQAASHSDQFEILEAQTAGVEGRDPRVKAFAREMVRDHTQTSDALQRAAAASGLPPPSPGPGDEGAKMLAALQGQRGADFDRTYARQQVLGHQEALVVQQGYAAQGADAAVRGAARSAVPVVEHHLEQARRLCAALSCES